MIWSIKATDEAAEHSTLTKEKYRITLFELYTTEFQKLKQYYSKHREREDLKPKTSSCTQSPNLIKKNLSI